MSINDLILCIGNELTEIVHMLAFLVLDVVNYTVSVLTPSKILN